MIEGRRTVRQAITALLPAGETSVPFTVTDLLAEYLDGYAEIILGPGQRPVGFMTHGEGREFTERVKVCLQHLGMPAAALAHHQRLATWFEHVRGFFKAEWHQTANGIEPLAAVYFRRRPDVPEAIDRMDEWGVTATARERVSQLAATLEKTSIHFVSAAFKPDHPVHHKLYFSQWLTPDTHEAVAKRIARVFELYGFGAGALDGWRPQHAALVKDAETTVFVSMSCTDEVLSPTFKIDYPDVTPEQAAAWVPEDQRGAVRADVRRACELGGTRGLTYLGVRFATDRPVPSLKYYADVPGSQ